MEQQSNAVNQTDNQKTKQWSHLEISISVQEPILNQKDTFKHFTYNVVGKDQNGPFAVRRRYSDFDLLRKKLSQRWLGIYIPPLNGKRSENNPLYFLKVFKNTSNEIKYVEFRRKFLNYFCQSISGKPYLYFCDLFQIFIRGGSSYQAAIQSCAIKEYSSLLKVYQLSFTKIIQGNQRDILVEQININENHLSVLKKSQNTLVDVCEKICRVIEAREQFNSQFNLTMKKTIPQYQQRFLVKHLNKNRQKLILNKCQKLNQKLADYQKIGAINPFQILYEMLVYEIREVKSFIDAIQRRKQAEKKKLDLIAKIQDTQNLKKRIQKGQFSFRALFMNGSKQAQVNELNIKIENLKSEKDSLEKMITIMVITTNYELQQFRKRRGTQYKQTLKLLAEKELVQMQVLQQILNMTISAIFIE